jgi:hypothetical protein
MDDFDYAKYRKEFWKRKQKEAEETEKKYG